MAKQTASELKARLAQAIADGDDTGAKDAFVLLGIETLANHEKGYKGVHVVYQGLNAAFKAQFGADPVPHVQDMGKRGLVAIIPAKAGVRLYWPDDKPNVIANNPSFTLAKMGL